MMVATDNRYEREQILIPNQVKGLLLQLVRRRIDEWTR